MVLPVPPSIAPTISSPLIGFTFTSEVLEFSETTIRPVTLLARTISRCNSKWFTPSWFASMTPDPRQSG